MTGFSVAITLASSRKTGPAQALRAHVVPAVELDLGAELGERVDVRIESPSPVTSPRAAAPSPGRTGRASGRRAGTRRASGCTDPRRARSCARRRDHADIVLGGLDVRADVGEELDHRVDVADAGHVRSVTGSEASRAGGEDRKRAVLVPGRADGPVSGRPPSITKSSGQHSARRSRRRYVTTARGGDPRKSLGDPDAVHEERGAARHAQAVEASTRWYARSFGEDEELWGATALLHDFDYEIHPTLDDSAERRADPARGGLPEELIEAVLSHAEHLAMPRDTPLKRTLYACDELAGFVHACGSSGRPASTGSSRNRPQEAEAASFAAGVHATRSMRAPSCSGSSWTSTSANVVAALQPIAPELGLRTAADAA